MLGKIPYRELEALRLTNLAEHLTRGDLCARDVALLHGLSARACADAFLNRDHETHYDDVYKIGDEFAELNGKYELLDREIQGVPRRYGVTPPFENASI